MAAVVESFIERPHAIGSDVGGYSPQYGQESVKQQSEEARARAGEQYAWEKAQEPRITEDLDRALDISKSEWERYNNLFRPVEDRLVADVQAYDSPEEMDRVRQEAMANANQALDTAARSRRVELMRMGVNPSAGAISSPDSSMDVSRSIAVSDAANRATAGRRDQAIALRAGVAGFGRQLPSTALASSVSATQALNARAARIGTPAQWAQLGLAGGSSLGNLSNQAWMTGIAAAAQEDKARQWRSELQYKFWKDMMENYGSMKGMGGDSAGGGMAGGAAAA